MAQTVIQDCGCLAFPEEFISTLKLFPGRKLVMELSADGASLILTPSGNPPPMEPAQGAVCPR